MSSNKGKGQPIILSEVLVILCWTLLSAAEQLYKQTELNLFGFRSIQLQIVLLVPLCQCLHFLSISQLIISHDQADYSGFISKLNEGVRGVDESAIMCLECMQKLTQHTDKGRAIAECQSGEMELTLL